MDIEKESGKRGWSQNSEKAEIVSMVRLLVSKVDIWIILKVSGSSLSKK